MGACSPSIGILGVVALLWLFGGLPAAETVPPPVPAAAPAPQALLLHWDTYQTLLVVDEGVGSVRPAYVVTYQPAPTDYLGAPGIRTVIGLFGYGYAAPPPPRQVVAYRAQAFLDAAGILHLDARKAVIAGPQADAWSPDSFAVHPDGSVSSEDDNGNGNAGRVEERILKAVDPVRYEGWLNEARIATGGGI